MAKGKFITWTDAHVDYAVKHYQGITYQALLDQMREHFDDIGDHVNRDNMRSMLGRMGLKNGLTGRFPKNHKTWNKGMTGFMGANVTSFKKGMLAHNKRELGIERRCTKDGYILVKVAHTGSRWRAKHLLVWEKVHGPLPSGHIVRIIDGNKDNFDIDNLICIPRAVHATLNRHLKPTTDCPELNKAIILAETLRHHNAKRVNKCKKDELLCEG